VRWLTVVTVLGTVPLSVALPSPTQQRATKPQEAAALRSATRILVGYKALACTLPETAMLAGRLGREVLAEPAGTQEPTGQSKSQSPTAPRAWGWPLAPTPSSSVAGPRGSPAGAWIPA